MKFVDCRRKPIHSFVQMTNFVSTQRVLGFETKANASYLWQEKLPKLLWGDDLLAQANGSRFHHYFCEDLTDLNILRHLLCQIAQLHLAKMHGRLVFDMDSTPSEPLGA